MKKELLFVVDPMCSWCWGFTPIIEELRSTLSDEYSFSLVLGGLRTKDEMPWNETSKEFLRGHWKQVSHRTGQRFSDSIFEKECFDYDTYPACKAVLTVRELFGMHSAFAYLHTIQEAFYTRAEDITNINVLYTLLNMTESDKNSFRKFFESDRAQLLMEHDFAKARSMGANAFPSVVIDEEGHMLCQKGYRSLFDMQKLLK
ncbi:MAG: DsbA family protein [Sulfurovum sp.]|uniref:DsbA family protein n=1 Tax=Sulfurovum sp. TaxID=1969726 RepID=UPI002867FB70|nr:DsbA family protein [Sulfurovum sp.]MCO4844586.1 DsbA family protein [Sulfurovum sp.]